MVILNNSELITVKKTELDRMKREAMKYTTISFVSIILFLVAWELLSRYGIIAENIFSRPSELFKTFIYKLSNKKPEGNTLVTHFFVSIRLALTGFAAAVIIGIPLGLFMGFFKAMRLYFMPIFEIIRPIPPIAWIPIIILLMGIGMAAKSFIIFVAAFVPCVINSYLGIQLTNPTLINVAKTFGASKWQIFTKVCIPASTQMVFAGVRVSLGSAWSALVAAELLASTSGLGYMIQMGRNFIRADIIIVGMLVIGASGALFASLLALAEKRIAPWRTK